MLHFLHISFILNVMSTILHEIFKLSEQFPQKNIIHTHIYVELSQL